MTFVMRIIFVIYPYNYDISNWIFKLTNLQKTNENITNLICHEYIKSFFLFFSIKIFNLSQKLWSSNKIIIKYLLVHYSMITLMIMIFLGYKMFFHWKCIWTKIIFYHFAKTMQILKINKTYKLIWNNGSLKKLYNF